MIIILKKPHQINPNNNNNIWELATDNSGLVYFGIQLYNPVDNTIMINQKYYPKPTTNRVVVNLTTALKDLCESVLSNINDMISYTSLPAYKIIITEYYSNVGNNVILQGHQIADEEIYYFFEGQENELDYLSYGSNKYNINATTKAKFLNNNKEVKIISTTQKEYLKIFNTNNLAKKLLLKCYDGDGDILGEVKIPISSLSNNVINLNLSPTIVLKHPALLAIETLIFTAQYKITILDSEDKEVTESRLLKIENKSCYLNETNIIYKNSAGGWDSIIFNNRVETITIDKKYLLKDNLYSNSIFQNNKENYNTSTITTYTASSDLLDDYESKQVRELLFSKKAYVAIGNYLVEITIDNKSYKVLQRHVNGYKKNRLEISFSTPFSIEQLVSNINIDDVPLNDNPDSSLYLADNNSDFIIDNYFNNVILKY